MTRDKCRYGAVLLLVLALALVGCATGGGSTAALEGLPIGTRIALPADAKALGDAAGAMDVASAESIGAGMGALGGACKDCHTDFRVMKQ